MFILVSLPTCWTLHIVRNKTSSFKTASTGIKPVLQRLLFIQQNTVSVLLGCVCFSCVFISKVLLINLLHADYGHFVVCYRQYILTVLQSKFLEPRTTGKADSQSKDNHKNTGVGFYRCFPTVTFNRCFPIDIVTPK